jgi:hypothetical protein
MKKLFLALFLSLVLYSSVFASTGSDSGTIYYNGVVYKIAELPIYTGKIDWSRTKIVGSTTESKDDILSIDGELVIYDVE